MAVTSKCSATKQIFVNCNGNVMREIRRMAHAEIPKNAKLLTTLCDAKLFMKNCLEAVGCPVAHADIVSANLIEADYRGHYSHGMNRLEYYICDIQSKMCNSSAVPVIQKEGAATALVDGNNGLGAVVGQFCMNLALTKAEESGVAMVVAKGSNHYGMAGVYTLQALKKRFLGISITNTSPFMVPTRAKESALGTNPISLGAPGLDGDDFVLDMATTAVAVGKIEFARRKGQPIPLGWALNEEGQNETDPEVAFKASRLMPLGGLEINSGYKGYGFGMLVEILSGVLSGANYGPNIRKWGDHTKAANLGHVFIAINPKAFTSCFLHRMTDLLDHLRNMEPADSKCPVLVHGDPERIHMEKVKDDGGIFYVRHQHEANKALAERLKVPQMVSKVICKDK